MKRILIIIPSLLLTIICKAQKELNKISSTKRCYSAISDLSIVDSIDFRTLENGISFGSGHGYQFRFSSDMTVRKFDISDTHDFILAQGKWLIVNNKTLVLKLEKEILDFEIVEFDKYYFFILPSQRNQFCSELKNLQSKIAQAKKVAYRLRWHYYSTPITCSTCT